MSADCLFCKIVAGDVPGDVVFDRGNVFAFRDINPAAPTHILIIPKEHLVDVSDLGSQNPDLIVDLLGAANELAEKEGISSDGYRIVTNKGSYGGQSVYHLHWHLLGGRRMGWPPG